MARAAGNSRFAEIHPDVFSTRSAIRVAHAIVVMTPRHPLRRGTTGLMPGDPALRAWSDPGWIKVAMEFRLEPTPAGTLFSTETRILPTDPRSRRSFAAYWFLVRASSAAIRREVLRVVARRAESPARQDAQR